MIVYCDTSALAKVLITEPGTEIVLAALDSASKRVDAIIGYVELRAAVNAAHRAGRLTSPQYAEALRRADDLWAGFEMVGLSDRIVQRAGLAATDYGLRALDAIHLAALMTLHTDDASLVCWDKDLRRAAADLGYQLIPETID